MTRFEAAHLIDVLDAAGNYNRNLLDEVLAFAGPARSVLDFGAGNGRLATALAERGFAVHCIEPDPDLRARLIARGLPTFAALAELAGRRFDYVVSLNVLEHCADDAAVVRGFFAQLVPNGRCLAYVPALRILWTANDTRVGHYRRYGRREVARLFRNAGFSLRDVRFVDSLGFLAALAYRCAGQTDGEITPRAVRAYDRFVFPVSLFADRVLHRVGGKNLLLRAIRPE
jgi:SAM-dependent methyltransferase